MKYTIDFDWDGQAGQIDVESEHDPNASSEEEFEHFQHDVFHAMARMEMYRSIRDGGNRSLSGSLFNIRDCVFHAIDGTPHTFMITIDDLLVDEALNQAFNSLIEEQAFTLSDEHLSEIRAFEGRAPFPARGRSIVVLDRPLDPEASSDHVFTNEVAAFLLNELENRPEMVLEYEYHDNGNDVIDAVIGEDFVASITTFIDDHGRLVVDYTATIDPGDRVENEALLTPAMRANWGCSIAEAAADRLVNSDTDELLADHDFEITNVFVEPIGPHEAEPTNENDTESTMPGPA